MNKDIRLIHPTHPLSRFYVHDPPLSIGNNVKVTSIEAARWYLSLIQDGKSDVAERLINTARLMAHPLKIAEWVKQQCGGLNAQWIFNASSVYMDIFTDQLQRNNSSFKFALQDALHGCNDPSKLMFIMCCTDNEYVWSCGLREAAFHKSNFIPGFNEYGSCLTLVSLAFLSGSLEPVLGRLHHYQDRSISNQTSFTKTVLLIGDSQCRQVEQIDCGDVASISGGMFQDAVAFSNQYHINFGEYAVVIISFGINDMQKRFSQFQQSWATLEQQLQQELQKPNCPQFIISLPFPHVDVGHAMYDCSWIRETSSLSSSKLFWLNWGTELECPFQTNEAQNMGVLDEDGFHLNHSGFREVWRKWAELVPDLKVVSYKMGKERRVYKKFGNGKFVQNW